MRHMRNCTGEQKLLLINCLFQSLFKYTKIYFLKETLRYILDDTITQNNVSYTPNLSHSQHVNLGELKSNENLIITKSDKYRHIVLMNRQDYSDKVNAVFM